jgi:DNA mismatch repair protein MutL
MPPVRILSDHVANQIAAGEVIERPAAVVKELVENALDAGARRIEVEFRAAGRALMRVEDDGCGMSRDDALLALERHATSKIREADDLNRLASYGFRGEALPSIASVSRFTLQTRPPADVAGTEILIHGGQFVHVRDCGRPVGTRIEVAQLFNSVPARRKFLKSDATEAAHIIQSVRLYALARPDVAFTLIEDGRTIFRSPESGGIRDRVREIFGRQIADLLIDLDATEGNARVHGLIGRPGIGRATRHEMITFVNQRPVDSRTLSFALIESYQESIPRGRYPIAFVFLEVDPAAVDVNVHPAKREVRFRHEPTVRGLVIRSVLRRIQEVGARSVPALAPAGPLPASLEPAARVLPPLAPSIAPSTATPIPAPSTETPAAVGARASGVWAPATAVAPPPDAPKPPPTAPAWRFVGFAHGTYALFETTSGLVLLDRRAAHERVWYERLLTQFRAGAVPSQRLLLPAPVELDPISSVMLIERLPFLNLHGIEIVEFGRNFFRIESVPAWMEPGDAETFLRDLLAALREGRLQAGDDVVARDELARLAALKAVRLPGTVSEADLRHLVAELFATRAPLTSPGGKPTYIELNHGELARRFQK